MFISCKVPKPLLPHLSMGPSTGSSLSSETFLPYSQLYLDYPNLPPQSTPTLLPLLCQKKKKSISVLLFLDSWLSCEQVLVLALLFQSEIMSRVHWFVQLKMPHRANINVPPSVTNYVNLSTFFTSHHLVILYLSRVTYVTSTVLSSKTVPASIKGSINNKTYLTGLL